jgi:hypothetical protein
VDEVIAVLGLPGLAEAMGGAGYDVLADDPAAVSQASKSGRPVIVIAGGPDSMVRISATSQAVSGGVVVWVGVDGSPPAPAGTIDFPAPIRIGDLLAVIGVTVRDEAVADAYVLEDGSVSGSALGEPVVQPRMGGDQIKPDADDLWLTDGVQPSMGGDQRSDWLLGDSDPLDGSYAETLPHGDGSVGGGDGGIWGSLVGEDQRAVDRRSSVGPSPALQEAQRQPAPAPAVVVGPSEADTDDLWLTPDGARRRRRGQAPVIVLVSQKGGLGVSSFSVAVSERAASGPGHLRTIIVDATGRDDLRPILWVPDGALPTVYDAHLQGDPRVGITMPTDLSQARPDGLPDLHFGVVLGPPAVVGRDRATPHALESKDWSVYASVISVARSAADLVVVVMSCPSAPAYRSIVAPPVLCAGVADDSRDGFSRLVSWWGELGAEEHGVLRAVLLNRVSSPPVIRVDAVERAATGYGADLLGTVPEKREVKQATSSGRLSDDADWLSAVDKCLELAERTPVRGSVQ